MSEKNERKLPMGETFRRHLWNLGGKSKECSHRDQILDITPSSNNCEECLAMGDTWVHLRICLICGQVGCCNDSKNKHAYKHFLATGHPLVKPFDENDEWIWCFADNLML